MIADYPVGMNPFLECKFMRRSVENRFLPLSMSPISSVTYYYLDEDRFELQCTYPSFPPSDGAELFNGITRYDEAGGFCPAGIR